MISNTISRAACLAELTSNPKSFFNCPDMHGGSEQSAENRGRITENRERGSQGASDAALRRLYIKGTSCAN